MEVILHPVHAQSRLQCASHMAIPCNIPGKSPCHLIGHTAKPAIYCNVKSQSKSFKHKICQPPEKRLNWCRKKLQSRLKHASTIRPPHENFTISQQCISEDEEFLLEVNLEMSLVLRICCCILKSMNYYVLSMMKYGT